MCGKSKRGRGGWSNGPYSKVSLLNGPSTVHKSVLPSDSKNGDGVKRGLRTDDKEKTAGGLGITRIRNASSIAIAMLLVTDEGLPVQQVSQAETRAGRA